MERRVWQTKMTGNPKRIWLAGLLMVVMGVALAACGAEATPTPGATVEPAATTAASTDSGSSSSGTAQKVNIDLKEWSITPSNVSVSAGKVDLVISNTGQYAHDLTIMDSDNNSVGATPNFKAAEGPKTLEVDLKPGTYKMLCAVPGHSDKGMQGTITVK